MTLKLVHDSEKITRDQKKARDEVTPCSFCGKTKKENPHLTMVAGEKDDLMICSECVKEASVLAGIRPKRKTPPTNPTSPRGPARA